jgi:hypothetical protein
MKCPEQANVCRDRQQISNCQDLQKKQVLVANEFVILGITEMFKN